VPPEFALSYVRFRQAVGLNVLPGKIAWHSALRSRHRRRVYAENAPNDGVGIDLRHR
jgi:hypothetical protein